MKERGSRGRKDMNGGKEEHALLLTASWSSLFRVALLLKCRKGVQHNGVGKKKVIYAGCREIHVKSLWSIIYHGFPSIREERCICCFIHSCFRLLFLIRPFFWAILFLHAILLASNPPPSLLHLLFVVTSLNLLTKSCCSKFTNSQISFSCVKNEKFWIFVVVSSHSMSLLTMMLM